MKLCINCKHYSLMPNAKEYTHLAKCTSQALISPVDGKPTPLDQLEWCSVMRLPSNTVCGLSAILYSEKESNHV